jgi:hypothetical protein
MLSSEITGVVEEITTKQLNVQVVTFEKANLKGKSAKAIIVETI